MCVVQLLKMVMLIVFAIEGIQCQNAVVGHHELQRVLDGNTQAHKTVTANDAASSEYPSICMTNQMSAGTVKPCCNGPTA